jgi:predicted MFS family arabinose efflux permease
VMATMLFATCFFQLFTNVPVFFEKELHLSKTYIGIIMSVNGIIIALLEMILVYKMENRGKNAMLISLGIGLIGVSFLLFNIPGIGAVMAFAIIIVVTFGEIFSMPFMNTYWISRTQPSNRGQYAALYTMAWSAAQCLGPFLGAQVVDMAGFNTLWWIIGGTALLASFSFYRILTKRF